MNVARLLPLVVVVPLLGAAVLAAGGRRLPRVASDSVSVAFAAVSAVLAGAALLGGAHGDPYVVEWLGGWRPGPGGQGVGIVLAGDPLSLGLAAFASLLVVAVLLYSWRYFEEPPRRGSGSFPALMLIFQAGMCGFCLTGDLFNSFVFFELMGVVAYALTGFRVEERRPVQGALAFGIVNSLGGYAMLLGIALLYARTGELGFAQTGRRLDGQHPDALVLAAFVLVAAGLLVKAAAVPFHFWLPDAHAVAPTPVSMLLSGVMVELGVFGVARLYWTVFAGPGGLPQEAVGRALVAVGVVTALLGAAMSWRQRHLKRLLAFSTVAHIGLFLIGAGLLTAEGTAGTSLYVLAHGCVKAALFACTGILLDRYASVDERELHGKARELPLTGGLFVLGGLAVCGMPPFGTSLGKAVAEEAAGHTGHWLTAVFVLASAVTGGAVLRAGLRVFAGVGTRPEEVRRRTGAAGSADHTGQRSDRSDRTEDFATDADSTGDVGTRGDEPPETGGRLRRIPVTMLAVPAVLLAAALAAGIVPQWATATADAAQFFASHEGYESVVLDGVNPRPAPGPPAHWTAVGVLLGLLSTALGVGAALLGLRRRTPSEGTERLLRLPARLQSGHIGDYVAWTVAGVALLALLTAPGTHTFG
ncbi:complex I subunit 5 family protein [Streptomyces marispadix]|uniref:Complex I subunit 5 family protein n=1 Tax=Streptomyces marispadix TaxID=2922868 RepID=A0ABS9SX92_9ACTN|nr:complex I subunit 5 family protein [Streptomyces marispadix]MCH6160671.1 complex I subunit 5 family protein [Streptomyces marispadix]